MIRNAADATNDLVHWLKLPFVAAACLVAYLIIALAKPFELNSKFRKS